MAARQMRYSRTALLVLAFFAAAVLVAGCGHKIKPSGKMIVAASIAPLADFSRQVGGKLVDVTLLVPSGASPHTYQLTPDQMDAVSSASVLVLNGISLEYWANDAIEAAQNPRLIVVKTAQGIPVIDTSDPDEPGGNPHTWVDPINAIYQVRKIRDSFIKADPRHRSDYTSNAALYIAKLRKLDSDIRTEVKTFRSRQFITFHPSWVYFAQEYGLKQAAVIERSPGREPSPAELDQVIRTARALKARAIFAEPQFSTKAADVIAEESGARVLLLDAIGRYPDGNYISMMRRNLAQMAKALK